VHYVGPQDDPGRWLAAADVFVLPSRWEARALVVQEAVRTAGAGAEIAARIQEEAFFDLEAPVFRVAGKDTIRPQTARLEAMCIPSADEIEQAVRQQLAT